MHDEVRKLVDSHLKVMSEEELTEAFWDNVKNSAAKVGDLTKASVGLTSGVRDRGKIDYKIKSAADKFYRDYKQWSHGAGIQQTTLASVTQFLKLQGVNQNLISQYFKDAGYGDEPAAQQPEKDDRQGEFDFNAPKQPAAPTAKKDDAQGEFDFNAPKQPTAPNPTAVKPAEVKQAFANLPQDVKTALSKMSPEQRAGKIEQLKAHLAQQKQAA